MTRQITDCDKARFNLDVGRTVRTLRVAADMSIAKLADESGVSSSMLTSVEHGAAALPLYAASRLADALDCTLDDIVPVSIAEPADED